MGSFTLLKKKKFMASLLIKLFEISYFDEINEFLEKIVALFGKFAAT